MTFTVRILPSMLIPVIAIIQVLILNVRMLEASNAPETFSNTQAYDVNGVISKENLPRPIVKTRQVLINPQLQRNPLVHHGIQPLVFQHLPCSKILNLLQTDWKMRILIRQSSLHGCFNQLTLAFEQIATNLEKIITVDTCEHTIWDQCDQDLQIGQVLFTAIDALLLANPRTPLSQEWYNSLFHRIDAVQALDRIMRCSAAKNDLAKFKYLLPIFTHFSIPERLKQKLCIRIVVPICHDASSVEDMKIIDIKKAILENMPRNFCSKWVK